MARYVNVDKLKHNWVDHFDSMYSEDCANMFKRALDEAPTEDVEPVVHAHWIKIHSHIQQYQVYRCSRCGREECRCAKEPAIEELFPYCHCGAKMDEEE